MPERGLRRPTNAIIGKNSRAAYYREYYQRKRKDNPDYQSQNRQRSAAWRAQNPDYARAKSRDRRADPAKYGADRARTRAMMRLQRADPAYRAREKGRARARYRAREEHEPGS